MDDGRLTQDYDAHVLFTFAEIPDAPRLANLQARVARWLTIAFAESWLAVLLYRTKLRLRSARMPLLPGVCDLISRALFQVQIGNEVRIGPGLMITHGQVVIDGRTTIGARCQINPWVTIGLSNSKLLGFSIEGPRIGDDVHIGTGAKLIGPITVGDRVRIGANAVVVRDVPSDVTVVGVPAHQRGDLQAESQSRAHIDAMRAAIEEYRTRQRSLRSMVDALLEALDAHADVLVATDQIVREDLTFLDAVAATGGDETRQVEAAVAAIDAALAPR
jgi:serine O-acetyltransferase